MSTSAASLATPSILPSVVRAALARLGAMGPGVIGVSGGADSVALLCCLAVESPWPIAIAHLNHQLRGADADADAAFVDALCTTLPHFTDVIDIRTLAVGDNLEAVARRARYDFFARVARIANARWVATAHTLDDQAETVLHRLIRGAGIRGLRGIAERRNLAPGVALFRPMLAVSRGEVLAYLREIGQSWREDATNQDTALTRNRIRHELLPLLRQFNPAIATTLARTADQAGEFFTKTELDVAALLRSAVLPRAGRIVIVDIAAIAQEPDYLVRELLNKIWEVEHWPRGDMTSEHWGRAAAVAKGLIPARDLPGGIRIMSTRRVVRIGPASELIS